VPRSDLFSPHALTLTTALVAAAIVPQSAHAQDTVRLSLADATVRALQSNREIAVQRETVALADAAARRAEGAYDPVFRLDSRGRTRTDPVNFIFAGAPEGALAPRVNSFLTSASFSRLFESGATASAWTSVSFDSTNSIFAPLSPSYLASLGVDVRQPLLQGRTIDPVRRAVRIAAVDRQRSVFTLERTAADIVAPLERAYWSLAAARRDVQVRRQAITLAEEQLQETRVRIEAGIAAERDVASPTAEIERRRGELLVAEEAAKRAEYALKALMLANPEDPMWDVAVVPDDLPPFVPTRPDVRASLVRAFEERPEVGEAGQAIARQDVEIDVARDRLRPALDLVASYNMRGLAGSENPGLLAPFPGVDISIPDDLLGNLGQTYANLFTQRFNDIYVGIAMSVPVRNQAAEADLASAQIARRQATLSLDGTRQRIAMEVRNAAVALETAAQRIAAARAGREAAEVQLQAEKDRYDAGLSTNFFVLTRQNDLAQAQVVEIVALADYQKARTEFARAVGTLLEDRAITVDAPPATAATAARPEGSR
jgi:outer membrane protein TolC